MSVRKSRITNWGLIPIVTCKYVTQNSVNAKDITVVQAVVNKTNEILNPCCLCTDNSQREILILILSEVCRIVCINIVISLSKFRLANRLTFTVEIQEI